MPSDPASGFRARYNSGETASSVAATVRLADDGLALIGEDGAIIDRWAWNDLRLTEQPDKDRPIRLSNRAAPDARLAIEDSSLFGILLSKAPYLKREPLTRAGLRRVIVIVAALVAVLTFFIYGLPWIARPIASLIPISWEERVGESTAELVKQVYADTPHPCNNEAGAVALRKLTGKLLATVETPYEIRVDVIDSEQVNALALPGGRIILFSNLITKAGAPDEVAGVLAHELAHVLNRHPTQGLINAVGWSALVSAFAGGASLSNEAVAQLAAHLATSAYSRNLEAEADDRATRLLTDAGIGTAGLASFFRSIQKAEKMGSTLPAYLSTHPETSDRVAAIERTPSGRSEPALSDKEWKALRKICSYFN